MFLLSIYSRKSRNLQNFITLPSTKPSRFWVASKSHFRQESIRAAR